ncbi:MAG: DNA primase catalytic subunit PriS [Candidatus Micrarchaeia archaeon]|jgi:DNA primase small subunit
MTEIKAADDADARQELEHTKEREFILKHFQQFYKEHQVHVPSISMREFGFGYEKKIDLRHKAFQSQRDLQDYFVSKVPLYASYSAAFYEYPQARPMSAKNFLKAELIFDLDANPAHEGHNPVMCSHCQETVRADAIRLLEDFLFADFGFSKDETTVNFSGSKGYHVHVATDALMQLTSAQRDQLVEYAAGVNVDFARFFSVQKHVLNARSIETISGPGAESKGWAKRILDRAVAILSLPQEEFTAKLKKAGYTKKQAETIFANRDYVISQLSQGRWSAIEKPSLLVAEIAASAGIGRNVSLDRAVTTDMSRLIRIPDTLHGDTGLIAKNISFEKLSDFDPTVSALAFATDKMQSVIALDHYDFFYAGSSHALEKDRIKEVPLAVAMLLLCKKKALLL